MTQLPYYFIIKITKYPIYYLFCVTSDYPEYYKQLYYFYGYNDDECVSESYHDECRLHNENVLKRYLSKTIPNHMAMDTINTANINTPT